MGRKGKAQKHTAKEIAAKHKAAKEAKGAAGGGGKMASERKNRGDKVAIPCAICKVMQPNFKSMTAHYESKHAKEWSAEVQKAYEEQFAKKKEEHKASTSTKGKGKKAKKGGKVGKAKAKVSHLGF
eukprot:g2788.t1